MKHIDEAQAGPQWQGEAGWSLPVGYKYPSCEYCGYEFTKLEPQRSVGGASVPGPICRRCADELADSEGGLT